MRILFAATHILAAMVGLGIVLSAQEIDSINVSDKRSDVNIASQIQDVAEREAFVALFAKEKPAILLSRSQLFLKDYPQSAFLAPVYEIAARSCFDLGDSKQGLGFAQESLRFLPENPLFQIEVADVQAREHQNDAAVASAQNALVDIDRFGRPAAIGSDWEDLKRRQQSVAWFAIGRAVAQEAFGKPSGDLRTKLFEQSASALAKSTELDRGNAEATYLLGVDCLMLRNWSRAAAQFGHLYREDGAYSQQARKQLRMIYDSETPRPSSSFESFLSDASSKKALDSSPLKTSATSTSDGGLAAYAGSETCKGCHLQAYNRWSQSGMAKMFRPYSPENIIGDFARDNEFYAGDTIKYENGKVVTSKGAERALFARMVIRQGRHYFDVKQSDNRWHSYPVDYTIGSKWQQAYATKLPNGQTHVFPIQYNILQKQWVNYWESIDLPGSERANPSNWEKHGIATSYQANCAVCHTSQLRNIKGRGYEADNLVFREPGIGCEMCHGPSSTHVSKMKSGQEYDKKAFDPPVDFDEIDSRTFVKVCAQCHMQSSVHSPGPGGELNYSRKGEFFLTSLSVPYSEFSRKAFFKDGRFSQTTFIVEAFQRSQCFRKGKASCGDCHDPHTHDTSGNNTSLKLGDDPDRMCVGCHTQFTEKAAASTHSHHAAGTEASNCVSCHMPRIVNALLFRARSHQIDDIPNGDMTARFGQEESPNACLICHSEKSPQWAQGALKSWKH